MASEPLRPMTGFCSAEKALSGLLPRVASSARPCQSSEHS